MNNLHTKNVVLDAADATLLRMLARDGRVSISALARAVGLSAPSVAERMRRLEERGVLRGYAAHVDAAALGLPIAAYIRVRPIPGQLKKVVEILTALEGIVACDRVTGEDCFIAKAYARSIEDLERTIDAIIPHAMTNTSIIQSTPVPPRLPPLPEPLSPRRTRPRTRRRPGGPRS